MHPGSRSRRYLTALLAGVLAAGAVAAYQSWRDRGLPSDLHGVIRSDPAPLPVFTLKNHHGERLSHEDLQGQWTLISFGFTHCPDVCPANLMQLAFALEQMTPEEQPRTWFVSVDPQRDTPEVLSGYVRYFHPSIVGVTGEEADLRTLERPLAAYHRADAPAHQHDHGDYAVAHSSDVYLVDPTGRYRARFEPPLRPEDVVRRYRLIRDLHARGRSDMRAWLITCLAGLPATLPADIIDISNQAPQEQCAYCHGLDGNSTTSRFPRLGGQSEVYLYKQLRDFRDGARGDDSHPMRAATQGLDDATLREIAAFFSAQPAPERTENPDSGDATLYAQGHPGLPDCRSCHGPGGEGNGAVPRFAGQHARYLADELRAFREAQRQNDPGGIMRAIADVADGCGDNRTSRLSERQRALMP